ncbi:MAG: hypothetical protein AMXMBFR58_12570 [Phycisphaerae bacterium]
MKCAGVSFGGRVLRAAFACIAGAAVACSAGCVTARDKSRELSRVAKDWCLTIRASQVIPCYPLIQDLQPGDVFLTQTPIGEEVREFEERGFLALDQQIYRIPADDLRDALAEHYAFRYDALDGKFPTAGMWENVPDAKFPSYAVDISRAGGLSLAVPVQGVPVGFNFLGAAEATASISISKATTYGLDITKIQRILEERWLSQERVKRWLMPYGTLPGDPESRPVYVRVVSRVFYTSEVNIDLQDRRNSGVAAKAGIDIGAPDDVSAMGTRAEMMADLTKKLNNSLARPLPDQIGGKFRFVSATTRSVTLNEEFARPLVIGYLAYDCQVLPDGTLGSPVATLNRIKGDPYQPLLASFDSGQLITAWYTKEGKSDEREAMVQAWLDANAPGITVMEFMSSPQHEAARRRMIRDLDIR